MTAPKPTPVPAVQQLLDLATETRPDLDRDRLHGVILDARTCGMPWPLLLTQTAGILARGEDHYDLHNAVTAWRKAHPQGA